MNNDLENFDIFCFNSKTPHYCFNCKDVDKDLLEQIVPLIHQNAKLGFFNLNHITRNDINILDSIFSEYFMSSYKTTLYQTRVLFYPEKNSESRHL